MSTAAARGQRWRRLGLAFEPSGQTPWLQSHAQNPIAIHVGDSRHRVYFASRDADRRAHIASVEIDLADPEAPASIGSEPALGPGPLGNFDDGGVFPSAIVPHDGHLRLYYIGLNIGEPPLYYPSIGLATSEDGGRSFERVSAAPIMGRSDFDPWMVSGPMVLREGETWRMWYMSGLGWERLPDGALTSRYNLKYAESSDGLEWRREGRVCIDHLHPGERNIARPCVIREGGIYRAWYSFAGADPYRIGYAESEDGLDWTRKDELFELEPEAQSWDSIAQAYPWVFEDRGRLHMVYCGNELGREGFGIAVQSDVGSPS